MRAHDGMHTTITIPTVLREHTAGVTSLAVCAATVAQALDQLTAAHPALRRHLFTEEGRLRPNVNVFVNDEDVRALAGVETTIGPEDTVTILPSIAGG